MSDELLLKWYAWGLEIWSAILLNWLLSVEVSHTFPPAYFINFLCFVGFYWFHNRGMNEWSDNSNTWYPVLSIASLGPSIGVVFPCNMATFRLAICEVAKWLPVICYVGKQFQCLEPRPANFLMYLWSCSIHTILVLIYLAEWLMNGWIIEHS